MTMMCYGRLAEEGMVSVGSQQTRIRTLSGILMLWHVNIMLMLGSITWPMTKQVVITLRSSPMMSSMQAYHKMSVPSSRRWDVCVRVMLCVRLSLLVIMIGSQYNHRYRSKEGCLVAPSDDPYTSSNIHCICPRGLGCDYWGEISKVDMCQFFIFLFGLFENANGLFFGVYYESTVQIFRGLGRRLGRKCLISHQRGLTKNGAVMMMNASPSNQSGPEILFCFIVLHYMTVPWWQRLRPQSAVLVFSPKKCYEVEKVNREK